MIAVHPLEGIGEVAPGDDLAELLLGAVSSLGLTLAANDLLVVTQKIVSKAENQFVGLRDTIPGPEAHRLAEITGKDVHLVQHVLDESTEIVRAAPRVLITRHRLGFVMANAGIDRSNLGPDRPEQLLLLPRDPDGSAVRLRAAIQVRTGSSPGIVISDSFGRPWRYGVTAVAIGAAGVPTLVDQRGEFDRDGRCLEVTQLAFGDMLATVGQLATGEGAQGIPAALIRGVRMPYPDRPASALTRPTSEDLFR